jgi:hypothetical protein
MFLRERTAFPVVLYALYLVFLGLSFRALEALCFMWLFGSGLSASHALESYTLTGVGSLGSLSMRLL